MDHVPGLSHERCSFLPLVKVLQVSEIREERKSQADQTLNNFSLWLHSFSLQSVHFSTLAYWLGRFRLLWSLQLVGLTLALPPPTSSILHLPVHSYRTLGYRQKSIAPAKSQKKSVRLEWWEGLGWRRPWREERCSSSAETPLLAFFRGRGAERKSIGKNQEACDGMDNHISALMF